MPNHQYAHRTDRTPDVNLNLNVRGLPPSATVAINERSNRLLREGRRILKLGLGQSPFPVPRPVVEELRANAHQKDYLEVRGLAKLREAVAGYLQRWQGVSCGAEDVLVGPGSKELMFLLQLVYYGDLVVPTPCWVSYVPQATIIGRRIHTLPTRAEDDWRLTPEQLAKLCESDPRRPRIVVLNYPNNPTGGTYRLEELKDLARVARRHRVILLSDEIYGETHFRGQHVSVARFYPEGTIVSGGLSKWCGAGGWRLGVFVFPRTLGWLREAVASVASETFTSTCAPVQYAAVRAYEGGPEIERYLRNCRRVLGSLGRWCHERLSGAGIRLVRPQGAFYLFPDFGGHRESLARRGIRTSAALCERLLEETGVAILPGKDFGRPPEELTARLAYVCFDGERALEAVDALPNDRPPNGEFLRTHCGEVLEAIEGIRGFVSV